MRPLCCSSADCANSVSREGTSCTARMTSVQRGNGGSALLSVKSHQGDLGEI